MFIQVNSGAQKVKKGKEKVTKRSINGKEEYPDFFKRAALFAALAAFYATKVF